MLNTRSKITTIFLIATTVIMVVLIFYISYLLTAKNEPELSPTVPHKTKAANVTYSKLITLNQNLSTNDSNLNDQNDSIATNEANINSSRSETMISNEPTPTMIKDLTPTPTEIILAYNDSKKEATSSADKLEETPTTVKTSTLPDSGGFFQSLFIFTMAVTLIFFSFLF